MTCVESLKSVFLIQAAEPWGGMVPPEAATFWGPQLEGEGETRSHECWLGYPWSQIAIRHGEDVRLVESYLLCCSTYGGWSELSKLVGFNYQVTSPAGDVKCCDQCCGPATLLILRVFCGLTISWRPWCWEQSLWRKTHRGWAFPELSVSKILHFILFGLLLYSLVHLHKCFETSMFCTTCRALAERRFQLDSGDTCGYFCPPE